MNISSKTNNYLSLILITSFGFSQTATAFVHTEVAILQDLLVELKQESASTQTKQIKEEQKQVKPEKKSTKAQPKKVVVKPFEKNNDWKFDASDDSNDKITVGEGWPVTVRQVLTTFVTICGVAVAAKYFPTILAYFKGAAAKDVV